jgi:hypothetical protein
MRKTFTLAAGLGLALAAAPAWAQGPSYEKRGYGGPLYVGPNFEQGGQHTPPVYGTKPAKKQAPAKRARNVEKSKPTAAKEANTEKASTGVPSATTAAESPATEKETEASATAEAPATPTTCKRFDATSGQTITVPCE